MALRTGRFHFKGASTQKIVQGGPNAIYRIFNSGSDSFRVIATRKNGGGNVPIDVELPSKNSIDIEPISTVEIVCAADKVAEGIYDVTGRKEITVRNGRFSAELKATGSSAETEILIAGLQNETPYRIFNTAEIPLPTATSPIPPVGITFKVEVDGTASHQIPPKQSFDFIGHKNVKIKTSSASKVLIEGIYDRLDPDVSIRSGRFTRRKGHSPTTKYKIVSTRQLLKSVSIYRIFNSGDYNFKIYQQNTEIGEIAPDQSLDVKVSKNKNLSVAALADNTIEGIYEFIGGE